LVLSSPSAVIGVTEQNVACLSATTARRLSRLAGSYLGSCGVHLCAQSAQVLIIGRENPRTMPWRTQQSIRRRNIERGSEGGRRGLQHECRVIQGNAADGLVPCTLPRSRYDSHPSSRTVVSSVGPKTTSSASSPTARSARIRRHGQSDLSWPILQCTGRLPDLIFSRSHWNTT
jgi:hypothetical protein